MIGFCIKNTRSREDIANHEGPHHLEGLYSDYRPDCCLWEVYQMIEKVTLVGIITFIDRGSILQVLVGLILTNCMMLSFLKVRTINFVLRMMNFGLRTINFGLRMMNLSLTMMNFDLGAPLSRAQGAFSCSFYAVLCCFCAFIYRFTLFSTAFVLKMMDLSDKCPLRIRAADSRCGVPDGLASPRRSQRRKLHYR